MSKEWIYKHYTEPSQLQRLKKASQKLIEAIDEDNFEYIIKRVAYVEFLTEQFKDYHKIEDKVYKHKYQLEEQIKTALASGN